MPGDIAYNPDPAAQTLTQLGIDPATAEAAATQITSASLSRFGQAPSPQFAWEAIRSNLTSTAAQAIAGAPNSAQPYITGTPAGQAPDLGTGAVPPAPALPDQYSNVYQFDWTNYWKQGNQQQLGQDQNSGWRSFGEVPQMNVAYMDGVRNQKDPTQIRKWQQMLQAGGWYQAPKYAPSGAWDDQTEAAFRSMMIAKAAPLALWGKGTDQTRANLMLGALGVDPTEIGNIVRTPEGARGIVQGWMQSLGPDAHLGDKAEVQLFADQFGQENLPADWHSVLNHDSAFSFIGNAFGTLGSIPLVGRGANVVGNVIEGNLAPGDITRRPQEVTADQIRSDLAAGDPTGKDANLLAAAVQQVNQDTGFLGMLDAYDRLRTRVGLTLVYMGAGLTGIGPLAHDITGKTLTPQNPWDDLQSSWQGSAKYQDNPLGGFLGDQWTQDHDHWAALGNFAVNTFDDPLTYFGPGAIKAGMKATLRMGMSEANRALLDQTIKTTLSDPAMVASHIRGLAANNGHINDAVELLGGAGMTHAEIQTEIAPVYQAVVKAPSEAEAAAALTDSRHVAHVLAGIGSTYTRKNFWENLSSQVKRGRLEAGGFNRLLQVGSYADASPIVFLRHDPHEALSQFDAVSQLAGLDAATTAKHIDAMGMAADASHLPGMWQSAWGDLLPAIRKLVESKGGTMAELVAHQRVLRNIKDVGRTELEHVYGVNPIASQDATDLAKMTNPMPGKVDQFAVLQDHFKGLVDHHVEEVQTLEQQLEDRLGKGWEAVAKDTPEGKALLDQLNNARQRSAELTRAHSGMDRSKPIWSYQLGDIFTMPVTPYELVSYLNPVLRASEKIQSALKINQAMTMWRRYAIGTISSAIHIAGGDDLLRIVTKYVVKDGRPDLAAIAIAKFFGRALGLATPGVRQRILKNIEDAQRLMQINKVDFAKWMQNTDRSYFATFKPGDRGYHEGLYRQIQSMQNSPDIMAWAKAGSDPAARRKALEDWWASDTPDSKAMRSHMGVGGLDGGSDAATKAAQDKLLEQYINRQHDMLQGFFAEDDLRALVTKESVTHADVEAMTKHRLADYPNLPRVGGRRGKNAADQLTELDLTSNDPIPKEPKKRAGSEKPPLIQRVPGPLPMIGAFKMNPDGLLQALKNPTSWPEAVFNGYTAHLVDGTRAEAAHNLVEEYMGAFEKLHGPINDLPVEKQLEESTWRQNTAHRLARQWMDKNMYQMGRTILGRAVRNAIPFWGATANQARFITRVAAHSRVGGTMFLRGGQASQKIQDSGASVLPLEIPGTHIFGSALSHLGFSGGDQLTFDPMNFLFVTRDGLGSSMPSLGPMFTPLLDFVGHNQHLAAAVGELPWLGEQLKYHTGQGGVMFPWAAKFFQGGAQALGLTGLEQKFEQLSGTGLFYGADNIQSHVNNKIKQYARENGTLPDPGQAEAEVGREMFTSGIANFLSPFQTNVTGSTADKPYSQALTDWRATTDTTQQDTLLEKQLGLQPGAWQTALNSHDRANQVMQMLHADPQSPGVLLAYLDRRLPSELRDQIATDPATQWVVAQSTSQYETADQKPSNLASFDQMRAAGNLHLLGSDEYRSRIQDSQQISSGWAAYEQLKNQDQQQLLAASGNTQDPGYVAWRQQYQSILSDLAQNVYPLWGQQYNQSPRRDTAGLGESTRPLRTLQTWEVMPWHQDANTHASVLWSQVSKYEQEASSELASMRQGGATKQEEQFVLDELNSRLQGLAGQDSAFAAQLAQFTYGKFDDVVNYAAAQA